MSRLVLLIILIASPVFLSSAKDGQADPTPGTTRQSNRKGATHQEPTANHANSPNAASKPSGTIAIATPNRMTRDSSTAPSTSYSSEEERHDRREESLENNLVDLTAILAIVEVVMLVIYFSTMRANIEAANAAKESANTARESLEISQRAHVSIEDIHLSRGSQWVDYRLRNSGHLPATSVNVKLELEATPEIALPVLWGLFINGISPDTAAGLGLAPSEVLPQRYPSMRNVQESDDAADATFDLSTLEETVRMKVANALGKDAPLYLQILIAVGYIDGFRSRISWIRSVYDPGIGDFRLLASKQD